LIVDYLYKRFNMSEEKTYQEVYADEADGVKVTLSIDEEKLKSGFNLGFALVELSRQLAVTAKTATIAEVK